MGVMKNVLLGDASFELSIYPLSRITNTIEQTGVNPNKLEYQWENAIARGNKIIDLNALQTFSADLIIKLMINRQLEFHTHGKKEQIRIRD